MVQVAVADAAVEATMPTRAFPSPASLAADPHPPSWQALLGLLVLAVVSVVLFLAAKTFLKPYSSQTHSFTGSKSTKSRADRKAYAPPLGYFLNKDHLYIYHQEWLPANGTPKGVVVLVHGLGEHCGRYATLANRLCKELGVAVVALDHQGHGKSEGDRLFVVHFEDFVADVMQLTSIARKKFGANVPFYMLGHSLGGLIAIRCVEKHPDQFVAAVFSAPALTVNASETERKLAPLISTYLPHLPMNKVDPNILTHDPCLTDLYCNDPLVTLDGVTARLGAELLDAIDRALAFSYEVTLPYLLIRGSADRVTLREGIVEFHKQSKSKDKTFTELKDLYHEIFNEVNSPAASIVIDWLKARMTAQSMI